MRVWASVCGWLVVCGCVAGQRRGQNGRPGQGQGQGHAVTTRLGLVSDQLGVDPVPGGNNFGDVSLPEGCFCLPQNQRCPGNTLAIDVRIVHAPGVSRCNDQKLCCPRGTNPFPNRPVTQGPRQPVVPQPIRVERCGIQNPIPYRQAGFAEADFGEYPWMAVVLSRSDEYLGGGVLLNNLWTLTAAHKVNHFNPNNMKVRLGELNVSSPIDHPNYPHVEVQVSQIIIHPGFNPRNLENDVALLRFTDPVDTSKYPHIGPACLPEQNQIFHGNQKCYVTGFGQDAFGQSGNFQRILKEVDVPMVDPFACQERLRNTRLGHEFILNRNSFLCAGGIAGKDACTGDGGAPLVCLSNGRWNVAGLVAWGIGCAQGDVPGVYVNVPSFANFILQYIGNQQG